MKKILKHRFIFLILTVLLLNKFEGLYQSEAKLSSRDFREYILSLNNYMDLYLLNINNKLNDDLREAVIPGNKIKLSVIRSEPLILLFIPIIILFDKREKIISKLGTHYEGSKYKDSISFS